MASGSDPLRWVIPDLPPNPPDTEATEHNPDVSLDLADQENVNLNEKGRLLFKKYARLGRPDDINKSIEYLLRGVALTQGWDPLLTGLLSNLGVAYWLRFKYIGKLDDLEKSFEYAYSAVLDPIFNAKEQIFNPACKAARLNNLGMAYAYRYMRLEKLDDAEKSIKHLSRAIELTRKDDESLPKLLANLGVPFSARFAHLGNLADIDESTKHISRAIELSPKDHEQLPVFLNDLGVAYSYRYKHLREQSDLDESIKCKSRAVDLTPDDHPEKPIRLTNLGAGYACRFELLGEPDDLDKSIENELRAVELTPNDHPDMPRRLRFLADSYSQRFDFLREDKPVAALGSLNKWIECLLRAMKLMPKDHPDMPRIRRDVELARLLLLQGTGNEDGFKQAMASSSDVLTLNPDDPQSSSYIFAHGCLFLDCYKSSGTDEHLNRCLDSFRKSCHPPTGAPRDIFKSALRWTELASENEYLNPLEAYQTAIDILPRFIWLGATTEQRYKDLLTAKALAVNASYAAILASSYSLAVEWLEHARQLHASGFEEHISQAAIYNISSMERVGQQRRHLATEYQHLLVTIRQLAGFEDFLQPTNINKLLGAAKNGPVVIINCHTDRCDALIVLPQRVGVTHIPLAGFNSDKAQTARLELQMSLDGMGRGERGAVRRPVFIAEAGEKTEFERVLEALWNNVVKPVLDHLGYTNNVRTDNLPHITWCPTGAMTFLPLHAAGDYDKPCSRVFDYAISSYTPTLTALLESTSESPRRHSRVLAVGQAATPGHAPLPGTALELDRVKAHMQGKGNYMQLVDEQATITAVLDEMERHDWVHLACHAHQDVSDAKQSGFFLHGGVLDLDAINRRSFKSKGLAFLSACQTATGDKKLPDEAVHLASGMLMAGYTSVIATMWSVHDEDAPFVADKVYDQLMIKRRLGNGEAGKALHHAVAGLREQVGEKEFGR
ncbi:unnamed protein product [Rhizoctonia solani]|uniref:CHAT domain-containing protein n=1 Tax=Rhizoctonia solani TaxID=456999 RepID=A0A8H3DX78_9AGAM|nr:unnamed protein product [Rhizoctonia solani]